MGHRPSFEQKKCSKKLPKLWQQRLKHNSCIEKLCLHLCCNIFGSVCTHMYQSLVFGDEFLAQDLHLKSHQRCSSTLTQSISTYSNTKWHCHFRLEQCLVQTHNSLICFIFLLCDRFGTVLGHQSYPL